MISLRPIRYRLATVLIGVTVVCVVLTFQKSYVSQRSEARQYIEEMGGSVEYAREFVDRRVEADGHRKRETWLSALLDRRTDDEAYIIAVDIHKVEQLPPIDELAGELRHFPNLMTITFPNLLDPDDYVRGVLHEVDDVGYFVEGPVRNNRSDPNTSPDFIRGID